MIPMHARSAVVLAQLDDDLAVATTAGQGLVGAARSLRLAVRAVESWRADPARAGCLCRAVEELRVALVLVDGLIPPKLRRDAVWTGPADDAVIYPVSLVARVLGRTARVLHRLARGALPRERPGPVGALPDAAGRAQCRTAWENTFHALIRLRAVQEASTWFADSAADPWLLLAAESPPPPAECGQCAPGGASGADRDARVIPFPKRGSRAGPGPADGG
ncbi:hypothetical protein LO772_09720 [Yinghuangia sp. ASG 101]|uniref:hypothetical protein n=1 Tax=Yinghuangia sp. ASG 101 TaxID=2896848 RepID=UPI001E4CDC6B|nr:hypothetical protein [Yinghuangia sp. ASG 101]UGQ13840.1 hypothetical protein LO772_09720 [Yinghuangia sp. ASG 101]